MAKLSWLKSVVVAIAGLTAITLATPASASPITLELDIVGHFNNGGTLGSWTETLFTTVNDTGTTVVRSGVTYEVYDILNITGQRRGITVTGPYDAGDLTTTDAIYLNTTTSAWAFDNLGFSVADTVPNIYNIRFLEYTLTLPGGAGTYLYDYTETGDSAGQAGGESAGLSIRISQVPTPTALFLLGSALLGLGVVRSRKTV